MHDRGWIASIISPRHFKGVRFGTRTPSLASVVGGAGLLIFGGWLLAQREQESTDKSEATGSVWDVSASWQYEGRQVESGGPTRGEQEQAIDDIQQKAEEMEHQQGLRVPQKGSHIPTLICSTCSFKGLLQLDGRMLIARLDTVADAC